MMPDLTGKTSIERFKWFLKLFVEERALFDALYCTYRYKKDRKILRLIKKEFLWLLQL
jgi:hypothetical protein